MEFCRLSRFRFGWVYQSHVQTQGDFSSQSQTLSNLTLLLAGLNDSGDRSRQRGPTWS
jgi:hypothetical protein